MKWNTYKKALSGNPKTFLVLPSVVDDAEMNRNSGLRLFTKAWPPKNEEKEENRRPLTATLEKPQVLDIRLVGKIDMSLMRKEFLSLTNLCRIPVRAKARRKTAVLDRRRHVSNLPVAIPPSDRSKLLKKHDATSEEDDSSLSSRESSKKLRSKIRPPKAIAPKKPPPDEINNNLKTATALRTKDSRSAESIKQLPEPCTTCGRPDQPERFHSHPTTPLKPIKKAQEPKVQVKSTVQKPVAMRYKSKVEDRKEASPRKPAAVQEGESSKTAAKVAAGPRTLTCYICGREFGTASLPLHEPKCLQKWQRENAELPVHLQQKAPVKPDQPLSKEEWNKFAWESSQAALTPCPNCGRTFFPDRLLVHQRACKPTGGEFSRPSEQQRSSLNKTPPKTVMCSVCGKLFGTKSIKIHEPQCLKKWHAQNDHLPPNQREPLASKKEDDVKNEKPQQQRQRTEERPASAKRPVMFPCYLCGKLFSVNSIYIHEPQCLRKWRVENEKLSPSKRRDEPMKPEFKFTPDGRIDFKATEDSHWRSHLEQLVPCQRCKRTFNPDRVEVHERSCKGPI